MSRDEFLKRYTGMWEKAVKMFDWGSEAAR